MDIVAVPLDYKLWKLLSKVSSWSKFLNVCNVHGENEGLYHLEVQLSFDVINIGIIFVHCLELSIVFFAIHSRFQFFFFQSYDFCSSADG